MSRFNRYGIPVIIATAYLIVDIFVRKVGGDLAGGVHYEPHTWGQIKQSIPRSVAIFIIVLVGMLIYQSFDKGKALICPNCEHAFTGDKDMKECNCPQCGTIAEEAEGFYKRHPDLKD